MGAVALKLSASANAAPVVGEAWAAHLGLEAVAVSLPFTEDFEAAAWADDFTELAQSPAPAFTASLLGSPINNTGANSLSVSFASADEDDEYVQIVTGLSAQNVAVDAYFALDSLESGVMLLARASGTSHADMACIGALLNHDGSGGIELFSYANGARTSLKPVVGAYVSAQNHQRWRLQVVDPAITLQQWVGSSWVTRTGLSLSGSPFLGVSGSAGFGVWVGQNGVTSTVLVDDLTIEAAS